jgi:hypothetical protein
MELLGNWMVERVVQLLEELIGPLFESEKLLSIFGDREVDWVLNENAKNYACLICAQLFSMVDLMQFFRIDVKIFEENEAKRVNIPFGGG